MHRKRLDAVLKWTNRIDLFSKNYIVVPINEKLVQYLCILLVFCLTDA